ncbi:class I SAM-dependent methyltransferase [Sphingobacterium sp. lm-10]|uniref:class I SAM-dependent methyltransferase n=1 Tax=Sphingobacterium sp. lm-10 TaxID=2944904 RepID=UPI00201FFF81|nr:class I SAM-dependent methyltransferase [Sphingobacterium sp. lm-10]MCL7988196.1 class I SAM-dependent methyltransferase [Sphingobacterium sp. lm-10]
MATEEELQGIAAQLRCPDGRHGVQIGDNMNETNRNMTLQTLEALHLADGDQVLELGYGNGGHLENLLQAASGLSYVGVDISQTMQAEAKRINAELIKQHPVCFDCYDGQALPYADQSFHKIFTVNTLYFWADPTAMLLELARVAQQEAVLAITFASKTFMKTLPFTQYGFTLYEPSDLEAVLSHTPWRLVEMQTRAEQVRSKVGDLVDRVYYIALLQHR